MTLSKLAKLANVSISVVSKAFSGKGDISDAMREHVFSVAREHGCFQQFYHVPYDKPVVAVLLPEVISEYYVHYIQTLKRLIDESGYTMLLSISNFDRQLASDLARYYTVHSKVDALLLVCSVDTLPTNVSSTVISLVANQPTPIGTSVMLDRAAGIRSALAHLRDMGHTRVGYVGEPLTHRQEELFKEETRELGLVTRPEWIIASGKRFEEAGHDGVDRILACDERPTALLGAYGNIVRGMLARLTERGWRVPEDMSVISMDSDPSPLDVNMDVTCIPSDIEAICAQAIALLKQYMHTPWQNEPRLITLQPSELHYGKTVKKQ